MDRHPEGVHIPLELQPVHPGGTKIKNGGTITPRIRTLERGRSPTNTRQGQGQEPGQVSTSATCTSSSACGWPKPSWMGMPLPPGAAASSSQTLSPAEQQLREVSSMLKRANQETLSTELQQFVAEEGKVETKIETKALHSAVKVLGKARDNLDEALLARSNLLSQWRSFLAISLERFRQYTDHFQNQERAHQENINKVKEALLKAKEDSNSTEKEATVISDDESEMKESPSKESNTSWRV